MYNRTVPKEVVYYAEDAITWVIRHRVEKSQGF